MPKMRAKLMVVGTSRANDTTETIQMQAVTGNEPFGATGESEDNTYARYTPSASPTMSITNPALVGT